MATPEVFNEPKPFLKRVFHYKWLGWCLFAIGLLQLVGIYGYIKFNPTIFIGNGFADLALIIFSMCITLLFVILSLAASIAQAIRSREHEEELGVAVLCILVDLLVIGYFCKIFFFY